MKVLRKVLRFLLFIFFSIFIFTVPCAFAVTLETQDGQLIGAKGVEVGGSFYNVSFVDGRADNLFFDGTNWDFVFTTFDTAYQASLELGNQVFTGSWDLNPEYTRGIESGIRGSILTPYRYYIFSTEKPPEVMSSTFINYPIDPDSGEGFSIRTYIDTTELDSVTWAVWSDGSAPVPEPSTFLLFGVGIVGIMGAVRRKMRN